MHVLTHTLMHTNPGGGMYVTTQHSSNVDLVGLLPSTKNINRKPDFSPNTHKHTLEYYPALEKEMAFWCYCGVGEPWE